MTKQREDIEDEGQELGQTETETEQQHDDQPDVEVVEKDGKTEVRTTGESRRQRLARERREETQRTIDAAVTPFREQLKAMQQMHQDLLNRFTQQPQVQQQQPQVNEAKKKFRDIVSRQEAVIERIRREGPRMSEEGRQRLKDEYYDLEEEKVTLKADQIASERISKYRPPEQASPYVQRLQMDHPDEWGNERAREYAARYAMNKVAELEASGTPPAEIQAKMRSIHDEAFERAGQVVLGKRKIATPSDGQRQRFAGTSASGRSNGSAMNRQLTEQERGLAIGSKQDSETEEQAIARWTKTAVANGLWER